MDWVKLGEVELPSGEMMILDPGLGRFWRHDGEPLSPRKNDPPTFDVRVTGAHAVEAGRSFDRGFHPEYGYDVRDVAALRELFERHCETHGFDAKLEELVPKVKHVERARNALEYGKGLGVVEYNGIWGVVIGGLPRGRPLAVVGSLLDEPFAGRFRSIDVLVDSGLVARSESVTGVMVEHGQLMCVGLEPLGAFRMWESTDGLADFVFRGRDAAAVAAAFEAPSLDDGLYGWMDVPLDQVGVFATPLQAKIAREDLAVSVDYRPHDNLERLNAQVRTSPDRTGTLRLDGALACGFDNRWGDGIFNVIRDFDANGRTVRIRIDVGNDEVQERMRKFLVSR